MQTLHLTVRAKNSGVHGLTAAGNPHGSEFELLPEALDDIWNPGEAKPEERGHYDRLRLCLALKPGQRPSAEALGAMGAWLFKRILGNSDIGPRGTYRAMVPIAIAGARAESVRIEIHVVPEAPQHALAARRLERLPWEMLFDDAIGDYWGLSPRIIVVRMVHHQLNKDPEPQNVDQAHPLRLGHLTASLASQGDSLDFTSENERVSRAVARTSYVAPVTPYENANISSLQSALSSQPHGLLLSAHGGPCNEAPTGTLIFHGDAGNAQEIDIAGQIRHFLNTGGHHPPAFVSVSSCRSVNIAHRLGDIAIASIGMSGKPYHEFANHLHACIISELMFEPEPAVAIHNVRRRLSEGSDLPSGCTYEGGRDAREIHQWQALFVVCVAPYAVVPPLFTRPVFTRPSLCRFVLTGPLPAVAKWRSIDGLPPPFSFTDPLGPGVSTILTRPARPGRFSLAAEGAASTPELYLNALDKMVFRLGYEVTRITSDLSYELVGKV